MHEKSGNIPPAPDPANDILIYRTPEPVPGSDIPEGNGTLLFAHPMAGETPLFYLWYRIDNFDRTEIRLLDSGNDAAAFIMGLSGRKLLGVPEPDRRVIREYFPGWFNER